MDERTKRIYSFLFDTAEELHDLGEEFEYIAPYLTVATNALYDACFKMEVREEAAQ